MRRFSARSPPTAHTPSAAWRTIGFSSTATTWWPGCSRERALVCAGTPIVLERSTVYLMDMLFADGTAPAFGDADDARGLWFRADAPADYRGPLALGSVLFGRGDFKAVSGGVTEEVFWLLGLEGVALFDALASGSADAASVAYPDAGYYVMRGGGAQSDPTLCSTAALWLRQRRAWARRCVELSATCRRVPFLVDSGTFSYNIGYAWRDAFRGTRAHNTLVVDGEDQSVPRDRMSRNAAAQRARRWSPRRGSTSSTVNTTDTGACRIPSLIDASLFSQAGCVADPGRLHGVTTPCVGVVPARPARLRCPG